MSNKDEILNRLEEIRALVEKGTVQSFYATVGTDNGHVTSIANGNLDEICDDICTSLCGTSSFSSEMLLAMGTTLLENAWELNDRSDFNPSNFSKYVVDMINAYSSHLMRKVDTSKLS